MELGDIKEAIPHVCLAAIQILGRIGDDEAKMSPERCLDDSSGLIRRQQKQP